MIPTWSKQLFDKAHVAADNRKYTVALLGRHNPSDDTISFQVDGRIDMLWVTIPNKGVVPARNEAGVPQTEDLQVKVYLDHGTWTIAGRSTRGELSQPTQTPPSGVLTHTLASHTDVSDIAPASGDVLQFSDFDGLWSGVPVNALGLTLDDLNGVTVPSPADGDVLTRVAGDWINSPAIPTAVAATIHAATAKTTPDTADEFGIWDSIALVLKRITYANIRDAIKSYYDSVAATLTNKSIDASNNTLTNVNTSALANDAVSNAKAANMANATVKGRTTAGTGDPEDLTMAQLVALIEVQALYALLAGRAAGQTLNGGTAANEDLILRGTAHATKASSYVALQDSGGFVVIGAASSTGDTELDVVPNGVNVPLRLRAGASGSAYIQFTPANASAEWGFLSALTGSLSFTHNTGPVIFQANATEALRLLAGSKASFGGLTSIGASLIGGKAGTSANDFAVGGVLYVDSGTHANGTTVETDLSTYTVPADTLAVDNQELHFEAWGTFAANTNTKTLKLKFGSDSFTLTVASSNNKVWRLRGRIIRTGAATQDVLYEFVDTAVTAQTFIITTATRTLSGANILKLTGQSAVAGGDVNQEYFKVSFEDANT